MSPLDITKIGGQKEHHVKPHPKKNENIENLAQTLKENGLVFQGRFGSSVLFFIRSSWGCSVSKNRGKRGSQMLLVCMEYLQSHDFGEKWLHEQLVGG